MAQRLRALGTLLCIGIAALGGDKPSVQHVVVYSEPDRFAGWPANNGVWSWGNEILVGFEQGYYKYSEKNHSIDKRKEVRGVLARSLDGGVTWNLEVPENWPGRSEAAAPNTSGIDFTHPGFAMRVANDLYWVSYDRGHVWQGP